MFEPWRGAKFGEQSNVFSGTRLLIVGEWHYSNDIKEFSTVERDFTTDVVEELALKKPSRFYTGLTQIMTGKKKWQLSETELYDLWDSICFYNYVPVYLPRSRVWPNPASFKQGAEPFVKVLGEVNPQAILVCGFDLWWWVLNGIGFRGQARETPFYKIGSAIAGRVMHPSATTFSSDEWRPTVIAVLDKARSQADAAEHENEPQD